MKTILVPTDFSINAIKALDYAVLLAKKRKSKIILLHVYSMVYINPDVPMEFYSEELFLLEKEAAKKLNRLQARINASKVLCEIINRQGSVVDSILEIIKKKKASMVIMGTKGATGMRELLIGSVTAKLISRATCPVIAVPEKNSSAGIKKIIYATDFHTSDIASLRQLATIADLFKAKINIVHIADGEYTNSDEIEYMEKFAQKVKQKISYKFINHEILYSSDVEKKLERFVKENKIDLIAVSTRHRNLIEKFFGKSITKRLAYHINIPMMVFHYKQEPVVLL
jgi:nucleotide-binding universal stress UspA family protein